jgi:hypothetical protein
LLPVRGIAPVVLAPVVLAPVVLAGAEGRGSIFGFGGPGEKPGGGVSVSFELAAQATPEVERSVTVATRIATDRVSDIRGLTL